MNKKQKMFIKYCTKNQIDTVILSQFDDTAIYNIVSDSLIFDYNNNPYCLYGTYSTDDCCLYVFRFKDMKSYKMLLSQNTCENIQHDYTFDYHEQDTMVNGHHLKTILLDTSKPNIYIFDEETKLNLICVYEDKVFFSRNLSEVIKGYHINSSAFWKAETEFPKELDSLITTNKILLSLK